MNKKNKKQAPKTKQEATVAKASSIKKDIISRQELFILFGLLMCIFVAYIPTLSKEFINYDDDLYITQNLNIIQFSFSKLPALFSHIYEAQYSPVASFAYGIVYMIAGVKPFLYNLVSVLLHITCTLLVFRLIWLLKNNFMIALFTAALFGLATIQVESVAWAAAAFKTGFYSMFFLLSLIVYIRYIKTKKTGLLLLSLLYFIVSCCSKEQAVSLSLAVIVVDLYFKRNIFNLKVMAEKIPYFLISIGFGVLTIAASQSNKDLAISSHFSFSERIIYAGYALWSYFYKMFLPIKMSLYYPYPSLKNSEMAYAIYPVIVLAIVALWIWTVRKKNSVAFFGGLFFFVNILFSLALQVVTVREVIYADRYAYLSCIGIFFIVSHGAERLVERRIIKLPVMAGLLGAYLLVTAFVTFDRTKAWKDTVSITSDAVNKHPAPLMYVNRGHWYRQHNLYDKALSDYNSAIAIDSTNALALGNRGTLYFYMKKDSLAVLDYNRAIKRGTKSADNYSNRGAALARLGKYEQGLNDLNKAIELNPQNADAYQNRALVYELLGKFEDANINYRQFLKMKPNSADIQYSIAVNDFRMNMFKESIEEFNKALAMNQSGTYYQGRSYAWDALGDKAKALADANQTIKLGIKMDEKFLEKLKK